MSTDESPSVESSRVRMRIALTRNDSDPRKEAITFQNLLDMTSGLELSKLELESPTLGVGEMVRSPDWVKFILDRPMSSAPGDVFKYNSGNQHLLSAILAKLTGMSTLKYAKAKLFGLWESTIYTGGTIRKGLR